MKVRVKAELRLRHLLLASAVVIGLDGARVATVALAPRAALRALIHTLVAPIEDEPDPSQFLLEPGAWEVRRAQLSAPDGWRFIYSEKELREPECLAEPYEDAIETKQTTNDRRAK
jgi:hypothetical protein